MSAPWLDDGDVALYHGSALEVLASLPAASVQTCVTSPPYWGLRSYLDDGHADKGSELGLEATPAEYVASLVAVFAEVWRVLRADGTLWLNLGDSYANDTKWGGSSGGKHVDALHGATGIGRGRTTTGLKAKDLVGIPWRVAFALQEAGWYLRSDIIWHKPSPMPESVTDRPTKSHEYLFLLSKQPRYFYDAEAIRESVDAGSVAREGRARITAYAAPGQSPNRRTGSDGEWQTAGRNARSVWSINSQPFSASAFDDGTLRKASPDCPVHGDRPAPPATAPDDGRAADPSAHNQRTDSRRALGPLGDSAPTEQRHALATTPDSSDSPTPSSAPAATTHSNETHRTGHDPATSPAYTASARTALRTGDTSASPESGALFDHTPASSISQAGSDAHLSGRTESRNVGKCSCLSIDHFATFPEALVRRCILAGTSERGGCAMCGAPWQRQTDTSYENPGNRTTNGPRSVDRKEIAYGTAGFAQRLEKRVETTGWAPSCACGAPAVPQQVLDPFMGSGTTALVARKLGRRATGIDLSADYLAIAARRLGQQSLFAQTSGALALKGEARTAPAVPRVAPNATGGTP